MTQGAEGCLTVRDGQRVRYPALDTQVVDTTGAGAAFHAGFLHGLLEGADPERCLHDASALAACAITRLGATTGLPTRDELQAMVRRTTPQRRESLT